MPFYSPLFPFVQDHFALTGITPDHPLHITPILLMNISAIYIVIFLFLTLLTHPVEVTADGGKELNIFLSQYSERGAPTGGGNY